MNIKVIHDKKEIEALEKLRYKVLNIDDEVNEDSIYLREIKENKIIPFALYYEDALAAGAYVSQSRNSVYIEYIFVKEKYQNSGLKLGRKLLEFILEHKQIIENYFGKEFSYSYLEPRGEKPAKLFEQMGYKETTNIFGDYKKRI